MAQCESWFKQDLKKPIKVQMLNGNLFSQDNQGNLIGVEVFDNGEPASLAGTVSANIIRADGGTVAATGTLSENKCSVVLPAAAYAIPGFATIVIKLTYSGVVTTLLALVVTVYRSSTDTAVDPGTVMPSIQSLIQQINTAVASIPADYSSLWTSLAPAFSTDASYVAGQYITNNGKVYRFNTAHAAGAWVVSEVTEVKLGNEISDLKSAVDNNAASDFRFSADDFRLGARQDYGVIVTSNTRITNKTNPVLFHYNVTFIPDETVKYYLFTENTASGWLTVPYTIDSGRNFAIVVAYRDDREITDISELLSLLTIRTPLQAEVSNLTSSVALLEEKTETLENKVASLPDIDDFIRNIGYFISDNVIDIPWRQGYYAPYNGSYVSSTTRCCLNGWFSIKSGETAIRLNISSNMKGRLTFVDENDSVISTQSDISWTNASFTYEIPNGAVRFKVSVAYIDNSTITPQDCEAITLHEVFGTLPESDESAYSGKIISILGDSISTFTGYSYPGNSCRYPQSNLLTDVNDTYWMRLINFFGMELGISETWAGSRVSNTSETDSGDVGPNRHIASATRIGHLGENGIPDIILVNAGTNDIGASVTVGTFNTENPMNYTDEEIADLPVATFADAYRTMLIRLQKSYPSSMIVCLLPNYTTSYYTPTKADEYCEIIKEACDYFGVKWFDMRTCGVTIFNRATYLPDGIHPNATGMELMFKELKKDFLYDVTVY